MVPWWHLKANHTEKYLYGRAKFPLPLPFLLQSLIFSAFCFLIDIFRIVSSSVYLLKYKKKKKQKTSFHNTAIHLVSFFTVSQNWVWHPFSDWKKLPAVSIMSLLIKLPLWVWPVSLRIRCPILKRAMPENHFDNMFKNGWSFFESRRPGSNMKT